MKLGKLIISSLLIVNVTSACAEEFHRGELSFFIEPSPKWVINNQYPAKNNNQHEVVDIDYLLFDRQINALPTSSTTPLTQYYHQVQKPLTMFGLEHASKIAIDFDPNYEHIIFHKVQILRNGQVINALKPDGIKLLQQEPELEQNLLNGKVTALLMIPASRLGDMIEYSYSIQGQNPVFKNHLFIQHRPEADVPIAHSFFRLVADKNTPLQYQIRGNNNAEQLTITDTDKTREYSYQVQMSQVHRLEDHVPEWFSKGLIIELTDFSSWQQVSAWAQPMYQIPAIHNQELNLLLKLLKPLPVEQQIIKALRFVQDDIRYLGLELANNSQQAHHPDVVMAMRFGDCKDKSLLFNSLLAKLNIKAYPALVNTQAQQTVASMLPSPLAFNHVISMVELDDGRQFWLDPSQTLQGGDLHSNSYHSYHQALLVGHPRQNLLTMPAEKAQDNRKQSLSQYWLSSFQQPVDLQMTTRYFGQYADFKRLQIATNSRYQIEQHQLNFMLQAYKELITTSKLLINDDRENNIFTVVENYRIFNFFELIDNTYYYDLDAFTVNGSLNLANNKYRHQPLALTGPGTYSHKIALRFPKPEMASYIAPSKQISTPYLTYTREQDNQDLQQVFSYQLEINASYVQALDVPAYRDSVQDIYDDSYETWGIEYQEPNEHERQENKLLELLNDLERKHVLFN